MPTIKDQLLFVGGCVAGAAGMYYADPHRGAYRRAILRDQGNHFRKEFTKNVGIAARDLAHRTKGVLATARSRFLPEPVADEILIARVASKIGRILANPHSIDIAADRGKIILGGPLFNDEVEPLLHMIHRVPGVRAIEKRLDPHSRSENFPALQGHRRLRGEKMDLLRKNWSPALRLVVGLGGGLVAISGGWLARKRAS